MFLLRLARRWCQKNAFVYRQWKRSFHSKWEYEHVCPVRGTDCLLTGWARSGNTFCSWLVRRVYPDLKIASHGHVIGTLKMAQHLGIPIIVLFRHPRDVLPSLMARHVGMEPGQANRLKDYLDICLVDWIEYYEYVLAHRGDFQILDFNDAVPHPENLFILLDRLGVRAWDPSMDLEQAAHEQVTGMKRDDLPQESQYTPNPQKEERKRELLPMVLAHPRFPEAEAIYQRLREHAVSDFSLARDEGAPEDQAGR